MNQDYNPSIKYQHKENSYKISESNPLTIKPEHIKLLRNMNIRWGSGEFGAPAVDSKRPYGNSDVIEDIKRITKMPNADREWCEKIHREMEAVLEIYLRNEGGLGPGDEIIYKDYSWKFYEGEK